MIILLTIALLVQPWIIVPIQGITDQMRLPQMTFMIFLFMGMICLYFFNGCKIVYKNKYIALLALWVFIRLAFNLFIPFSLEVSGKGRILNYYALDQAFCFIFGLIATYIALSTFEKEDYIKIAKVLCLSGSLVACWSILQFIGFDPFGSIARYSCENRVSACLDNPNVVGNYLALTTPLFLIFNERKYILGILLVFVGIGVTRCHFAQFLSILAIIIFSLQHYKNKWIRLGILIACLIGILALVKLDYAKLGLNMSGRLDTWKTALQVIKSNPLFGHGMGYWKSLQVYIGSTYWFSVHNDWLERIVEIGLVGFALIWLVIINTVRNFRFTEKLNYGYFSMFIVFLVMMFGSFPLETATIGTLGWVSFIAVEHL